MQRQMRKGKRLLALVMALVMALSTATECLAAVVPETVKQGDGKIVTWGELAADAYAQLTDAEKDILRSGMLRETVTYTAPGNDDDLISVDTDTKTVSVKTTFVKNGITWTAGNARISYTEGESTREESIALNEQGKGTFSYSGNDYTAKADYTAVLTMGLDAQKALLKTPRALAVGWFGMKEIAEQGYMADLLGANIDSLVTLVNTGMPIPGGGTASVHDSNKAPVEELKREVTKNASGALNIVDKVGEYKSATSKTQYLVESGTSFRTVAADYRDTVGMLVDANVNQNCLLTTVTTMLTSFGSLLTEEQKSQLETAKKALELLKKSYDAIKAALVNWETADLAQVFKAGMTAEDFAKMDALVTAAAVKGTDGQFAALTSTVLIDSYVTDESMRALTATVTAQVNRFDVTVKVQANVIPLDSRDSADTVVKNYTGTLVLALKAGMSEAEVEEAIDNELAKEGSIDALAQAEWTDFGVSTANYNRTLVANKSYSELAENLTYTVTYEPKMLNLNVGEGSVKVPYGYNIVLPDCPTVNDAYYYTLNNITYEQGEIYRVVADTIFARVQDTAKTGVNVGAIVRSAIENDVTAEELAVLKSDALKLNSRTIRVRYPGANDVGLIEIKLDGGAYTVTATEKDSQYKDLQWIPVRVVFEFAAGKVTEELTKGENGKYIAAASGTELAGADVTYQLTLTDQIDDLDVGEIVNLPGKLAADAAEHKAIMNELIPLQSDMNQIKKKQLNVLVDDDNLPEYIKEALNEVFGKCFDDNDLTVYNYVKGYAEAENGLAYLYQGGLYGSLVAQANILYTQLDKALGGDDPAKQEESEKAIKQEMEDLGVPADKYSTLLKIRDDLKEIVNRLNKAPLDEQIDTSKNLTEFAGLIEAVGTTTSHGTPEIVCATTIRVGAPGKKQVVVAVGNETISAAFEEGHELTAKEVKQLESDAKAKLHELLGEDTAFYTEGALTGVKAGDVVSSMGINAKLEYSEKQIAVTVNGSVQNICLSNRKIILPAATSGESNEYTITIDGQTIAIVKTSTDAGAFEFTKPQLAQMLAGSVVEVASKTVDVNDAALREFVEGANAAIGNNALGFLMLEDESTGKINGLILRVGIDKDFDTDAVVRFGKYLTEGGSSMDEIRFVGGTFYDGTAVKLSLKALVDTVLRSGMTLQDFRNTLQADGTMNEMSVPAGKKLIASNVSSQLTGAKLLETGVTLTMRGSTLSEMPLYVTMESFGAGKDKLAKLASNLDSVLKYVNATAAEGTLSVQARVPVDSNNTTAQKFETAWGYVMAAMLLTGQIDLENVSAVDISSVVNYLYNGKLEKLYKDTDVDLNTVGNTLKKIGLTDSAAIQTLTEKNDLYKKFRAMQIEVNSDTANKTVTLSAGVYAVLEALLPKTETNKSTWNLLEKTLIDEAVSVPVKPEVETEDYVAMVAGSKGVSFLSDNDIKALTVADNYSLVVLLKDCRGKLNITGQYVYVDLRGHTFNGDITGTEQYKVNNFVVDSILDTNGGGKVTGKVTNVVLAGGTYTGNTDGAIIRTGYTKDENGNVTNDYYTVTTSGNAITVVLKATAQSLRDADKYTVAALASDLASDLLLNYYSTAQKVTVDGHTLYDATIQDITTLFQGGKFHVSNAVGNSLLDNVLGYTSEGAAGNYDGVNYMIGSILDALLDFQNLADSIGSNNAAVSYSLTATAWDVTVDKAESGDYLAIGITGSTDSSKTKRQTLNVFLNSDSEKNNEQLKNALEQLAGIIEVDAADKPSLSLDRITLPQELGGKTVQAKLSGSGHVTVKISDKPVYAALMAITVANSLPAGDSLRAELKNAVETFYNNNDAAVLKTTMEKVTCAQVFAALKTVGLRTNFLQMAISVGFGTDSKTYKAISESYDSLTAYRGGMAAAGWLLKQLNINGNGATLAGFQKEFGIYEYAPDKTFNKTATVSGDWKVNGVVSMENAKLTLELFAEDNAILVTDSNGKRLYNGDNLNDAIAQVNNGGVKLTFHKPVTMTGPVDAITKAVTIVNADKLTQGSFSLALGLGGSIHADSMLSVMSADAAYYVKASGHYLYELVACEVTLAQANGSLAYYHTVEEAAAAAENGAAITVNGLVRMTADVAVSGKTLTIRGVQYIVTNDHKLQLSNGSKLVADGALTVVSGEAASYVLAESSNGTFTYTLKAWEVTLTKNGANSYFHTLEEAVASASNGATITVNSNVTMSGNVNIGGMTLTIKGAAKIAQGSYQFLLNDVSSKLIADSTSLNVELGLTGKYTLVKRTDNGMTTYSVKEKTSGGGGGGGGSYTGSYIYLDVQPSGINAKQLQTAVRKYFNDSSAEVTIYSGLTASGLVANGASIYVSGSRAGSYTVIIMGDTNCNGKTDSGDAVKMRNHYFGTAELTGVALEAADMNRNGKVDSGDAVKNRVKYQGWRSYRSELKITV